MRDQKNNSLRRSSTPAFMKIHKAALLKLHFQLTTNHPLCIRSSHSQQDHIRLGGRGKQWLECQVRVQNPQPSSYLGVLTAPLHAVATTVLFCSFCCQSFSRSPQNLWSMMVMVLWCPWSEQITSAPLLVNKPKLWQCKRPCCTSPLWFGPFCSNSVSTCTALDKVLS